MTEKKRYVLGDRRLLIERLKESYIDIMQVAEIAHQEHYISPKFRAVVSELISDLYYNFVERLNEKP